MGKNNITAQKLKIQTMPLLQGNRRTSWLADRDHDTTSLKAVNEKILPVIPLKKRQYMYGLIIPLLCCGVKKCNGISWRKKRKKEAGPAGKKQSPAAEKRIYAEGPYRHSPEPWNRRQTQHLLTTPVILYVRTYYISFAPRCQGM